MNHIAIRFILLAIAVLVCSCSDSVKEYTIGVSQCSNDKWRQQMNAEMRRQTLMYDDCRINLEIRSANDNNERQIKDIKYFINKKVDLLVVAPNEAERLTPIIERAYDMGIPVLVVDRKIASEKYTAFVGADNVEIGREVARYISSQFGEKLNIVEFTGLGNSSPAIERHRGFAEMTHNMPNINSVAVIDAMWSVEVAHNKMDSLLRRNKDVNLVFAHNDPMAMGAYIAAKKYGKDKSIRFIGIDALPGDSLGMGLVRQRKLAASFVYPTGGRVVLDIAMNILKGKDFNRHTSLQTAVVDSTSVEGLILQNRQISTYAGDVEKLSERITDFTLRYNNQTVILYSGMIILLLMSVFLIVTYRMLTIKSRLNSQLEGQRLQLEEQNGQLVRLSKELEDATQAKLVFFTNISHDFRTPLTLVADPIDQILASDDVGGENRKLLMIAKKNTAILLRLVNQILDFRKYENGKMEFMPEPIDMLASFKTWNVAFTQALVKKHLHFNFDAADNVQFVTMADKGKIERIYFNLMSNALKFTPANGSINVRLFRTEENNQKFISFSILNTGSIIEPEHISKIFDRFYKTDLHYAGSGIGLALVKALVEMHHGRISVESAEKSGTIFVVDIPEVECESSHAIQHAAADALHESELIPDDNDNLELDYDNTKPLVLVIDDNADIRTYVSAILSDTYSVIEASSGQEGIRKAVKLLPDLIVCDIMMPGIDGLEVCRRLKSELYTSHIPVMMLTACSLDEQRISGYACGADSYISKPFSSSLLKSRIANLIESRIALRKYFSDGGTAVVNKAQKNDKVSDIDKDFVERFHSYVNKNISNSELNVEDIAREMGFSRVQLYRKLKAITNYSPNEFVRVQRLKKARTLLLSHERTVAEIAYEVGFTSPSYFTKCYKEYFGENPTNT